jgi:GrpB-like predicted nucleotidyltransferase (UPF0157 family)
VPTRDEIITFDDTPPPPGADPWVVVPKPGKIELAEYNPAWPAHAQDITARLEAALGVLAVRIEHVGSTSVPGLRAKPVIDLDVTVADPANEAQWLPQLEAVGYVLTVREPWWHEHRMLRGGHRPDDGVAPTDGGPVANIHIFGVDSAEPIRNIVFRNWLRADPTDRALYAAAKSAAAAAGGSSQHGMEYNARKQDTIREICRRAFHAAGLLD